MRYKMVIFDLDGTILNTIEDLWMACNEGLKAFGLPLISVQETADYLGHGIRHLLDMASHHSKHLDQILAVFKDYYATHYNVYTKPYEGIYEVFDFCRQEGILTGVLSNKVEEYARGLCAAHFPNAFSFVYGELTGRERKPNPSFLYTILQNYGVSLDEVLYIGDSDVDILTCQNANIEGLFVSYGFRKKEILMKLSNHVVDSPQEVLAFLKGEHHGF